MELSEPELLLDAQTELGESPAWDAEYQRLFWVNTPTGELHIYNPRTGQDRVLFVGEPVGCVAPAQPDTAILALRSGFAMINLSTGELYRIANPELRLTGNRFNDGKCDPAGRFLAGTMDDAEQAATGSLYSLDAHGHVTCLLSGIYISNGLAWSPDYETLYYIDTHRRKVMAYDYDLTSGQIANPRVVVRVAWPDGMTSDREGRLWIALWGQGAITVWDPYKGKLLETIKIPAIHVTSCVFGGEKLNELYITTARRGMDAFGAIQYPASGSLFRVITDVKGMPSFRSAFSPNR